VHRRERANDRAGLDDAGGWPPSDVLGPQQRPGGKRHGRYEHLLLRRGLHVGSGVLRQRVQEQPSRNAEREKKQNR